LKLTYLHISLEGEKLHTACFVCSVCGEAIQGRFFRDSENGKYLCLADYQDKAEKCDKCQLPILERFLTVNEHKYHAECFRCCKCDKSLDGIKHYESEAGAVCSDCYKEHFAEKCERCAEPLDMGDPETKTRFIICNDNKYHLHCYNCTDCGQSLENQHVYLKEDNIVCEKCSCNEP